MMELCLFFAKWIYCPELWALKLQFAWCIMNNPLPKWLPSGNERRHFHMEEKYLDLQSYMIVSATYTHTNISGIAFVIQQHVGLQLYKAWSVYEVLYGWLCQPESALPHSSKSGLRVFHQGGNLLTPQSRGSCESLLPHSACALPHTEFPMSQCV